MKEQLTLEMLCSYLPYGLKGIVQSPLHKEIDFVEGIYFCPDKFITLQENGDWYFNTEFNDFDFKPIFHPLSELEGTEQWNEIVSEHNYPDFGHFERSVLSGHAPHKLIMELVKEHFWIYDQSYFEKKIILDVNELNK